MEKTRVLVLIIRCFLLFLFSVFHQLGQTATASAACQYTYKDLNGYIKTPGYPNPYSHGLNCSWEIIVPAGRKIKLDSKVFDVENSYNCERDALYIYDGSNEKAKLYSRPFCHGNGPKNVVSSSNSLYLRFITDRIDNGKGFLIQYRSFKVCDFEFYQNGGWFTSPNFPLNYNEDANCSYRITAEKGRVIVLKFEDFALENKANDVCLDYVNVYDIIDGAPKLKKTLCGKAIPLPIKSVSNKLLVKFRSDALLNNPGFNATFHTSYHHCGSDEFKCDSGRCIKIQFLCDGVSDCRDKTDEKFCSCKRYKCENSRCISHSLVCDGENSCGDWSDESRCQEKTNPLTKKVVWRGLSTTLSPRTSTTPYVVKCGTSEYQCKNKNCIAAPYRCDGNDNCGDNSDESDCYGQCKNLNGGCEHQCEYDRSKGVQCRCYNGFKLDSDGKSCIDIDECSGKPCAEICTNTYGSYYCECKQGYRVSSDGHNCTDFNECTQKGHCEQICINKPGSFECACYQGYVYNKEKNQCLDQDECQTDNGGCAEKCINTIGSYNCECNKAGYALISDSKPCEEVNECELGTAACEQICINTDGSYRCSCHSGYHLDFDKHNCLDINECQIGVPGCFGDCINTLGSYRCDCDFGFKTVANNTRCADIDECEINNGGCSNLCINLKGTFECKCHEGYVARDPRSFTCVDKDECQYNPCEGECINTPGSFLCTCASGYQLVNKTKCVDVNECQVEGESGCQYRCTNTPGSFFCTCPDGFILKNDRRKCILANNATGLGCKRLKINTKKLLENSWTNVTEGWGWQASLTVNFSDFKLPRFNCIGILINIEFVLTTGHCVRFGRHVIIEAEKLTVVLGSYSTFTGNVVIAGKDIIFHETLDIALVRLSKPVTFTKRIQPICLPQGEHDVDISVNHKLLAVTWARKNSGVGVLQQMYTKIITDNNCKWHGKQLLSSRNSICVNFALKENVLPMSGSPLFGLLRGTASGKEKWILTGFLMYGSSHPGNKKAFQGNNVAYHKASLFVDWIHSTLEKSKSI